MQLGALQVLKGVNFLLALSFGQLVFSQLSLEIQLGCSQDLRKYPRNQTAVDNSAIPSQLWAQFEGKSKACSALEGKKKKKKQPVTIQKQLSSAEGLPTPLNEVSQGDHGFRYLYTGSDGCRCLFSAWAPSDRVLNAWLLACMGSQDA